MDGVTLVVREKEEVRGKLFIMIDDNVVSDAQQMIPNSFRVRNKGWDGVSRVRKKNTSERERERERELELEHKREA